MIRTILRGLMMLSTISTWNRPDSPFQSLLSVRMACLLGAVGAILTVVVADLPTAGLVIGCLSVGGLYASYPFYSLATRERSGRATEFLFTAVGLLAIVLAVAVDPRWLALGWLGHGLWDLGHHRDHHRVGIRGIPPWWVQGCLVWDFLAAIGLALLL